MNHLGEKNQTVTIGEIVALLSQLRSGNFTGQLEKVSNTEVLKPVFDELNSLVQHLQAQVQVQAGDDLASLILRKEELRSIFETMSDGLVIQDSTGKILQFNPAALSALGLTEDQLMGRTSMDPRWKAVREDGTDFLGLEHPAMIALRTGEKVAGVVMGIQLPSGDQQWLRINATPFESKGDPIHNQAAGRHVIVTFANITHLRKIEDEAELAFRRLEDAQAIAKIGSWDFDIDSHRLNWSVEHFNIFEIQKPQSQEILYRLYRERIHHDDIEELDRLVARATTAGEDFIFNHRLVFDNGLRIKHVQGIGKVQRDKSGRPMSISGTCQDLTDSINLQEENRFILDALGIGVWKFNPGDQSLFWDKSMYQLYGVKEEDFSGHYQAWESSLTPEAKEKAVAELGQALRGEKEFNTVFEIRTKTGARRQISGIGKVLRNEAGAPTMMYGVNQDVTIQRKIEFENERMAKFLDVVLDHVPSMIFVKDFTKELQFSLFNKAGEDLLGVSRDKMIGKNDYDFFPKDQADFFTQKDKEVFLKRALVVIDREEINTPIGKRLLKTLKVPTFDQNGKPQLLIGISNDVTDEVIAKEALERERVKSLRNAKLASLGEMSAGIAHEINNPLAIIAGTVRVLPKFAADPNQLMIKIDTIEKAAERIAKIVRSLRKFSRSADKSDYKTHFLGEIVNEAVILTAAKAQRHGTSVKVECRMDCQVVCDEIEIEQVMVNLINNAIDAVKKHCPKWVQVDLFEDGTAIVLQVRDSGTGLSEETQKKLFQPFFTTKPVGQGTGLGLSIAKGILDEHQATIEVITTEANTCFEIRFKKAELRLGAG